MQALSSHAQICIASDSELQLCSDAHTTTNSTTPQWHGTGLQALKSTLGLAGNLWRQLEVTPNQCHRERTPGMGKMA